MNIDNAKYLDKIEKIQKRYPYQQMPEHLKQAFEQDMRIRLRILWKAIPCRWKRLLKSFPMMKCAAGILILNIQKQRIHTKLIKR